MRRALAFLLALLVASPAFSQPFLLSPPPKTQVEAVACTRSQPAINDTNSGSWTRLEGRFECVTGATPMRSLRVCLFNGYINALTNFGEVSAFNASHLEGLWLERNGGTVQPTTWNGGQASLDQQPGDFNCSDPLDASAYGLTSFAAKSIIWLRFDFTKAAGDHWNSGYTSGIAGEGQFASTAATTQANGTGAMTLPSGGTSIGIPREVAVYGTPANATRDLAVCILGDSIDFGLQDNTDNGSSNGGGPHVRALRGSAVTTPRGGAQVPYIKMARGSDQAFGWIQHSYSHFMRGANLHTCDVLIEGFGTNDITAANLSPTQVLAEKEQIWADARSQGVQWIITRPMLTVTTSLNGWTTADDTNQTANTKAVSGGAYDQLDALLALVEGTKSGPDVVMWNFRDSVITRQTNGNRIWLAPGGVAQTSDGIHPNLNGNPTIATTEAVYINAIPTWVSGTLPANGGRP